MKNNFSIFGTLEAKVQAGEILKSKQELQKFGIEEKQTF